MKQDKPSKNQTDQPSGRLDHPVLRMTSILVAIFAMSYSLANSLPLIPVLTGVFFLMLWFIPQIWKWIAYVFSKQLSSSWGRFILNLVLAIIIASIFEDVLELFVLIAKIISWAFGKLL